MTAVLGLLATPVGGLIIFAVATGLVWLVGVLVEAGRMCRFASWVDGYLDRREQRRRAKWWQAEREREAAAIAAVAAAAACEDTLLLATIPAQRVPGRHRRGGDAR